MRYLENKAIGFYMSVAAAILALAGLCVYHAAPNAENNVMAILAAVVVLQIAGLAVLAFIKGKELPNLILTANTVLMAAALVNSFRTQLDKLGYVVSGLYDFSTVQTFVVSAVLMLLSMVIFLISSWSGFEK